MDSTIHVCVYHLQCDHYKDIKPPSYFDYPELNHLFLTRDREQGADYYEKGEEDAVEHRFDEDLLGNERSKSYPQDVREGNGQHRRDPSPGRPAEGTQLRTRIIW